MARLFLVFGSVSGFLGVAFGAFGAHGLKARFSTLADGADRLGWWQTAAQYQLIHAVALLVAAVALRKAIGWESSVAGWGFIAGTLLFSGSLYVMALTGIRVLGAVTPLGGLSFLAGWAALAIAAWKMGTE